MANDSNYATHVVRELKGGALLYPKNIPDVRGNTALILQVTSCIVMLGVATYLVSKFHNTIESLKYSWYCVASNILLLALCGLIWRICNLMEEFSQVTARYDNDIIMVFKAALQFNIISTVVIVLALASFIGIAIYDGNPLNYLWEFGPKPYIFALLSSMLVVRLINLDESRLDTALKLSQLKGLDYGSSMAYSYFYGYLNIVLPSRGDESKGLLENIEQYEAIHQRTIPMKKLFILIPTSLHIPPDLKEASNNWLEAVTSLESVVKNRAGTRHRTYHNTVYKIHPGGEQQRRKPIYVITEGATPLLTFYEVLQHSGIDSTSYNDFRKEIVGSFYRTLRHIIKSKENCRDLCELVFYEDVDSDQKKVNVAKILLEKIQEQTALAHEE